MRSRYSAFVLGRLDYLLATWHTSTRLTNFTLDAAAKWSGLEVRAHRANDADHTESLLPTSAWVTVPMA